MRGPSTRLEIWDTNTLRLHPGIALDYDVFGAKLPKFQAATKRELDKHEGNKTNE